VIGEQPRLVDLDPAVGDPLADHTLLGDRLAERRALVSAAAHQLQRTLGGADRAHAVVDAARTQPRLGDREAAALLAEQVGPRDPDVLEGELAMALVVVVAEDQQVTDDRQPGASSGTNTMLC
jgi:hypothetical protein